MIAEAPCAYLVLEVLVALAIEDIGDLGRVLRVLEEAERVHVLADILVGRSLQARLVPHHANLPLGDEGHVVGVDATRRVPLVAHGQRHA